MYKNYHSYFFSSGNNPNVQQQENVSQTNCGKAIEWKTDSAAVERNELLSTCTSVNKVYTHGAEWKKLDAKEHIRTVGYLYIKL